MKIIVLIKMKIHKEIFSYIASMRRNKFKRYLYFKRRDCICCTLRQGQEIASNFRQLKKYDSFLSAYI